MKERKTRNLLWYWVLFLAVGVNISACSSSKDVTSPTDDSSDDDTTTTTEVSTGVYSFSDLVADSTATYTTSTAPLYFSLETGTVVDAKYAQSNKWDICFNSIYNSNICANNGSLSASPGYGSTGIGQIYLDINSNIDAYYYQGAGLALKSVPTRDLFDSAFAATTSATTASSNWEKTGVVGLDYFGGSTSGWAWYDFYGALFPDSASSLVAHVCYALPRTVIVKTAKKGYYAKVVIYSLYKGAPEVPTRNNKSVFFTLKYAIQKDGTTNLDIK
ncbi:MAG: hypothetical protein QM610_12340 [Chitinophagaceae bacterium]